MKEVAELLASRKVWNESDGNVEVFWYMEEAITREISRAPLTHLATV